MDQHAPRPRKLGIEYPGANCQIKSLGDRREDIFSDGVNRQDFLKTLAEACLKSSSTAAGMVFGQGDIPGRGVMPR